MMMSTPSGSKGKAHAPTNWCLRTIKDVPSTTQLSLIELPMEVMPEQRDMVPAEYAVNTQFLVSGTARDPPGLATMPLFAAHALQS